MLRVKAQHGMPYYYDEESVSFKPIYKVRSILGSNPIPRGEGLEFLYNSETGKYEEVLPLDQELEVTEDPVVEEEVVEGVEEPIDTDE